jgi:hypothetical protein
MRKLVVALSLFEALLVAVVLNAAPAQAQATRTWVSGVGDDVNPCSRTAPCKTFAGAISKTAVNGEINCLDSAGFGAVTITKSLTIKCEGVIGGILAAGTTGVIINDVTNTAIVTLSGLDIDGAATGLNGVRFLAGAALHVSNTQIRGFRAANANGILVDPASGTKEIFVADSAITDNGPIPSAGGIVIRPTGTGAANVFVNRTQIENNNAGIRLDGTATSGEIRGVVRECMVAGNVNYGITAVSGAASVLITVDRSSSVGNNVGLVVNGANASLQVGNSTITANNTGLFVNVGGGQIRSFGNNVVSGNVVSDGAFTGSLLLK